MMSLQIWQKLRMSDMDWWNAPKLKNEPESHWPGDRTFYRLLAKAEAKGAKF